MIGVGTVMGRRLKQRYFRAGDDARADAMFRRRRRPGFPSLSHAFISLAIRRLSTQQMSAPEKERWEGEMKADIAVIPGRIRRILVAYRIWHKGSTNMPTGGESSARPAGAGATSQSQNPSLEEFYRRLREAPPEPPSEWAP